jgi:hypothetical protein
MNYDKNLCLNLCPSSVTPSSILEIRIYDSRQFPEKYVFFGGIQEKTETLYNDHDQGVTILPVVL